MGLTFWRKAPTEKKSMTLMDPAAMELFGAVPTSAGIHVGSGNALRVPAVAAAVGLISETVGSLPAKIYDRETRSHDKSHPAHRLIHEEANDWTSAEQLRVLLTADALMHGHGFAYVVRLASGQPFELHRIEPGKCVAKAEADGTPFYEVHTPDGVLRYEFTDILHVSAFGGMSPIHMAREAIALAIAFERHVGSLFANGGRPSGIIQSGKNLDVTAKKKVAESWFNTHGRQNAGGTAILDEGMTYQQISMTLTDAQFSENRLEQIREIARAFRIPPTMIGELTRGTWSNTEEMGRQFLTMTLNPWLKSWEWAYSRVLLTPEERRSLYIEFVVDDLITTNSQARATSYGQYRAMGAMTANEVRGGLNLPPLPGGDELGNPFTTSNVRPNVGTPQEDAA